MIFYKRDHPLIQTNIKGFLYLLRYFDKDMKNQYLFSKGWCGTFLHKHEVLQLSDGTGKDTQMVPMQIINKTPLQQLTNVPSGPIAGKLWRNEYQKYCCFLKCPCGSTITHQIQGFKTKLAEVRTGCCYSCSKALPFCDIAAHLWFNPCYLCCPRNYQAFDGDGSRLGQMTYSCCQMVCCVTVTVANKTDNQAFTIRPKCCVPGSLCGAGEWFIRDRQDHEVAHISKACCRFYPHIQFSFKSLLSNADKLLLMSAVPHLP